MARFVGHATYAGHFVDLIWETFAKIASSKQKGGFVETFSSGGSDLERRFSPRKILKKISTVGVEKKNFKDPSPGSSHLDPFI